MTAVCDVCIQWCRNRKKTKPWSCTLPTCQTVFFFFRLPNWKLPLPSNSPHPLPFCCGLRSDLSLRIKIETRPQFKWEELCVLSQTGTRSVSTLEMTSYARTHTTSEQKKLLMEKTFDFTTTKTNTHTHTVYSGFYFYCCKRAVKEPAARWRTQCHTITVHQCVWLID